MPPKPQLTFSEVTRRLTALNYELVPGPVEGFRTFTKTIPPYFPYITSREIAFPVPYADDEVLPGKVVENLLTHLFLTTDEDEKFWANEPAVN